MLRNSLIVFALCAMYCLGMGCAIIEEANMESRLKITHNNMQSYRSAVIEYRGDLGVVPTKVQGMEALRTDTGDEKWDGPYLRDASYKDGWGQMLVYEPAPDGKTFKLISSGTDKVLGTEDDIVLE